MSKLRQTRQKKIIKDELDRTNRFFDAEELWNIVKEKDPSIGIATVYRYLSELEKQGKVFPYTCHRRKTYSTKKNSHCHFICEETGKVIHFEIDNLDFIKDKIPGDITSFQIEVRGICKSCKPD